MRNSERYGARIFVLIAMAATAAAAISGCGSYGDPCLRTTDCGSGFVCVEGKCVVDLGDNPSDAAPVDAPISSDAPGGDTGSQDVNRDAGNDASGGTPDADASRPDATRDTPDDGTSGPDALRDVLTDGDADAAERAVLDAPRETGDSSSSGDDADARATTDATVRTNDALGGDVRRDADTGSVSDATPDDADAPG